MPGTRRTPIGRSPQLQITPRAIRLFEAMRRCWCICPEDRELGTECAGCARWRALHGDLWDELQVPIWQWPCVEDPRDDDGKRPEAVALWRELENASREARRQQRAARKTA
jgi:hypothetical protein